MRQRLTNLPTAQLDADTRGVLQEGLLEAYVVLENEAAAAAIVAEADETVIQRFYLLRPELVIDLEDLVIIEFDDPLPVVPSG